MAKRTWILLDVEEDQFVHEVQLSSADADGVPEGISIVKRRLRGGLRDGVDIVPEEFYRKLRESTVLPKTSQPSAGSFLEVFRELAQTADSIIAILVGVFSLTLLSGIYPAWRAGRTPPVESLKAI